MTDPWSPYLDRQLEEHPVPDLIRPEDIDPGSKAILDRAAGKDHSEQGPVMACLAEILTDARRLWRSEEGAWQQRAAAAEALIDRALLQHPRDVSNPAGPWCPMCMVAWPCGTVLALTAGTAAFDPAERAAFTAGAEERLAERQAVVDDRAKLRALRDAAFEKQVRDRLSAELLERAARAPAASGFRRGLRATANVVAPDPTPAEVAEAVRSGNFVACESPEDRT